MTESEIDEFLRSDIASFLRQCGSSSFNEYLDWASWEDWMDCYIEGDEPSESELKKIVARQLGAWQEYIEGQQCFIESIKEGF